MSLFHRPQQEQVDQLIEAYRSKALSRRAFMLIEVMFPLLSAAHNSVLLIFQSR